MGYPPEIDPFSADIPGIKFTLSPEGSVKYTGGLLPAFAIWMGEVRNEGHFIPTEELKTWRTLMDCIDGEAIGDAAEKMNELLEQLDDMIRLKENLVKRHIGQLGLGDEFDDPDGL